MSTSPEMKTKYFGIRLDEATRNALHAACKAQGLDVAEVLRDWMQVIILRNAQGLSVLPQFRDVAAPPGMVTGSPRIRPGAILDGVAIAGETSPRAPRGRPSKDASQAPKNPAPSTPPKEASFARLGRKVDVI